MRPLHITFLITAALSQGAVLTYTSLATWQTANGGAGNTLGTETFESVTTGFYFPSLILGGSIEYTGDGLGLRAYSSGYVWSTLGTGQTLTGAASPAGIVVNFPTGIYAFGFMTGVWGTGSSDIRIYVNGNLITPNFTANLSPSATPVFIGIRETTTPITSISIAAVGSGNRINLDNAMWAGQNEPPPAETPEAATAILIGSALLLLPALRRRFGNSSSTSSAPQQLAH